MRREGTIYKELQRSRRGGELSGDRYVKGVGRVTASRWRWVAEISWNSRRYRFRTTNYSNARFWLDCMIVLTEEDDGDCRLRRQMKRHGLPIRYPKKM